MLFLSGMGGGWDGSQGGDLIGRGPGQPLDLGGNGLGPQVGKLVRLPSSRSQGTAGSKKTQLMCPGTLALPRVPAEQAGKEEAGGQLRHIGHGCLALPGWASVGLSLSSSS